MTRPDAFDQLRDFDAKYLPFPTFVEAKDAIEANLRLFRETGIAKNMLVLGESGTGKTSLCRWLQQQHPRRKLVERDEVEVLWVSVPPAASIVGVANEMLIALGDPWRSNGTTTEKSERVAHLCKECRVELLLIDEAQHLQDRGQTRTHYMIADWFKHLIDTINVPTVLLGLPRSEALLQANDQLRRRFSRRVQLALGQSETESIDEQCLQLFYSLTSLLQLPVSARQYKAREMGLRLYYACDGRVAYIKRLIFAALQIALEIDADVIDVQLLEQAFTKELWSSGVGKLNPFSADFEFRRLDRGGEPFQAATPVTSKRKA